MYFKQTSRFEFSEGDWKVSVTTEESGKHGNVVMVAYGDKGNSGQIMLGKCGNKKLFNAGNVDEFKVSYQPISFNFTIYGTYNQCFILSFCSHVSKMFFLGSILTLNFR